jgi:DNA-directed RNA polymerase subunit RPC12/RpoP
VTIAIACPQCDSKMAVSDRSSGKRATCPRCGQRFLIPGVVIKDYASENPKIDESVTKSDPVPPISFDVTPMLPSVIVYDDDVHGQFEKKPKKRKSPRTVKPLQEKSLMWPMIILGMAITGLLALGFSIYGILQWRANHPTIIDQ